MDEDTIERNTKSIEESLRRLLQPPNSGLPEPMIVNNLDWFGDMPLLVFLRDVGKAFCCCFKLSFMAFCMSADIGSAGL